MSDWIILKCSGSRTLLLAKSLAEAGFSVWSPTHLVQIQRARRKIQREDVPAPIMPSFVFAHAYQVEALLALSHSPSLLYQVWDSEKRRMVTKGHPTFTVFGNGSARPVRDNELHHLRLAERRCVPKAKQRTWAKGDQVKLSEAGFGGLVGTVQRAKGQRTWVEFPDMPAAVEIQAWVLLPAIDDTSNVVHVGAQHSERPPTTAKAA